MKQPFELIKKYKNRYCYKRQIGNTVCFEVIKLKNGKYPSDEDFGISLYGVCLNQNDINLESKIDFYLHKGFKARWTKN